MTSQKEHIQALIAEIDIVLQRTNPRLPWIMSGEAAQQRQVLERVRNFLVALQQTFAGQEIRQPSEGVQALAAQLGTGNLPLPGQGATADMTPYQMMQAILQEVSYLRANLTPAALQQSPANPSQLTAELLQVLMSRLQENLSQQIAQTLDQIRQQSVYGNSSMLSGGMPPVSAPSQYEQLQNLRSRSDQMLVNLDSTLNVVFESLQRNIQAYQEALSQGLERMYSMGQQSEYTFKVLIDQLAQQLKQEASSYLLSSPTEAPAQPPISPTQPEMKADQPVASPARSPISAPPPSAPVAPPPSPAFPYAGSELLSTEISGSDLTPPPTPFPPSSSATPPPPSLDSAIESWLQSVSEMNLDDVPQNTAFAAAFPPLDLSDLNLETTDFTPTAAVVTEVLPATPDHSFAPASSNPTSTVNAPSAVHPEAPQEPEDDTADIDAVLKLLEELSAEVETSENVASLETAEAQLEQILQTPLGSEGDAQGNSLPEDAREELDEFLQDDFYQSLFGSEAIAPAAPEAAETTEMAETAVSLEELFDSTATSVSEPAVDSQVDLPDSAQGLEPLLSLGAEPDPPESSLFELQQPADTEAEPSLYLELPADLFGEGESVAPLDLTPTLAPSLPDNLGLELVPDQPELAVEPTIEPVTSLDLSLLEAFSETVPVEIAAPPKEAIALPDADTGDSLTTWFQGVTEASTRSVPIDPPIVRNAPPAPPPSTTSEPEALFLADDLFGKEPAPDLGENQFTRAASDESLLPNTVLRQNGINLELDDFTLNSLSQDLSNLEEQSQNASFDQPEISLQEEMATENTAAIAAALPTPAIADEDLSLESFAASLSAPPPVQQPAPFYQASAAIEDLSIEGFANLFGGESAAPATPVAPISSLVNQAETQPFSVEGTTNLFEAASPPPAPLPTPLTDDEASPFTLEGMDDLFGDAPAIDRGVSLPPIPAPPIILEAATEQGIPFTLEGMDDLFEGAPPLPPLPEPSIAATPQIPVDLVTPPPAPASRGIPPFKPELFHPDDVMEPLPDFKLERLDNLFDEPSAATPADRPAAPTTPDQQALDAAFESLLGPAPHANSHPPHPPATPQKKKTP